MSSNQKSMRSVFRVTGESSYTLRNEYILLTTLTIPGSITFATPNPAGTSVSASSSTVAATGGVSNGGAGGMGVGGGAFLLSGNTGAAASGNNNTHAMTLGSTISTEGLGIGSVGTTATALATGVGISTTTTTTTQATVATTTGSTATTASGANSNKNGSTQAAIADPLGLFITTHLSITVDYITEASLPKLANINYSMPPNSTVSTLSRNSPIVTKSKSSKNSPFISTAHPSLFRESSSSNNAASNASSQTPILALTVQGIAGGLSDDSWSVTGLPSPTQGLIAGGLGGSGVVVVGQTGMPHTPLLKRIASSLSGKFTLSSNSAISSNSSAANATTAAATSHNNPAMLHGHSALGAGQSSSNATAFDSAASSAAIAASEIRAPPKVATSPTPTGSTAAAQGGPIVAAFKNAMLSDGVVFTSVQSLGEWPNIIAYNISDMMCFSYLGSMNTEPMVALKLKGFPTTHTLSSTISSIIANQQANVAPNIISSLELTPYVRLLVGYPSGEVNLYTDLSFASVYQKQVAGKLQVLDNQPPVTTAYVPYVFNKDGAINSTRVNQLIWLNTSNRFVSIHHDGTIIQYDLKFKSYLPPEKPGKGPSMSTSNAASDASDKLGNPSGNIYDTSNGVNSGIGSDGKVQGRKCSHLAAHEMSIYRPHRGKKMNPASIIQIGCKGINRAEIGPPNTKSEHLLALACKDGYLRVIDMTKEVMLIAFRSYYGAFLCVSWSADGAYLAAGSEDDLVTVFSPFQETLVARLQGHSSWISSVCFDPIQSDPNRYRLASAGQDTNLIVWEVAVDSVTTRTSQSQKPPPIKKGSRRTKDKSEDELRSFGVVVEAPGRAEVIYIEPVVVHFAHTEPLTCVQYIKEGIITTCVSGMVKFWARPVVNSGDVPSASSKSK